MNNQEINKREFNQKIDNFIQDFLKEEIKTVEQENKQKKYRKHFEQTIELNSTTNKWAIILNGYIISHYETKDEAEEAAEQMNFVYNLGLFEGIIQGKELQQKSDEENLEGGLVLSIFETKM